MQRINGVLFTGGAGHPRDDAVYFETAYSILKLVEKANKQGVYFPLYGICLGMQTLVLLHSGLNTE